MGKIDPATEKEILRIEDGLQDALMSADLEWIRKSFTADAVYVHMSGGVDDLDEYVDRLATKATVYLARQTGDVKMRRYGDTVVVTGYSNIRIVVKGAERPLATRFTRVYVRENGAWKLASSQSGANTLMFPDGPGQIGAKA